MTLWLEFFILFENVLIFTRVTFDQAIDSLRTYLELSEFRPNSQGSYPLVLDDTLEIEVLENKTEEALYFWGLVMDLPGQDKREKFLKSVLKTNLARAKISQEYLTLDSQGQTLMLYTKLSLATLEEQALIDAFELFVSNLEHWQKIAQDNLSQASTFNPIFPIYP